MSKTKTTFHCQECGAEYAKWQGQCNKCGSWNSIAEEIKQVSTENLWDHTKSDLNNPSNNLFRNHSNNNVKESARESLKEPLKASGLLLQTQE